MKWYSYSNSESVWVSSTSTSTAKAEYEYGDTGISGPYQQLTVAFTEDYLIYQEFLPTWMSTAMNKNIARIIGIACALGVGIFVIALAQYDSRQQDREEADQQVAAADNSPAQPIAIPEDWDIEGWDKRTPVVRANNELPGTDAVASTLPRVAAYPSEEANKDDASDVVEENPLRRALAAASEAERALSALESEVVQAGGPSGGQADPQVQTVAANEPPSWLTESDRGTPATNPSTSGASLPRLPESAGSLPSFPSTSNGSAPAPNSLPAGNTSLQAIPSFPMSGNGPAAGSTMNNTPAIPSLESNGMSRDLVNANGASRPSPLPQIAPTTGPSTGNYPALGVPQPSGSAAPPQARVRESGQQAMRPTEFPTSDSGYGSNNSSSAYGGGEQIAAPKASGAAAPTSATSNQRPYSQQPNSSNYDTHSSSSQGTGSFSNSNVPSSNARVPATMVNLVSNQPGSRYLDGSQSPLLQIQKRAPEEISVGKKATFIITVRNAGNATAHGVTVVDSIPRGVRFAEAQPPITPAENGLLTWQLGELAAGDEKTISLQVIPEVQGEIGSVASVHFAAQASVRTVATLPMLKIQLESSPDVLIGSSQSIVIQIKNEGTGVAKSVRLEADIPAQLKHESGDEQLEAPLGDLRPNESKRVTLSAAAAGAGQGFCVVRAVTEDGIQAEEKVAIDVRAPKLQASIVGPSLRYLERHATYQIKVQNVGTAAASNLDFVVHLPAGLKFISTDVPQGSYDPGTHTVTLGLYELAAGQTAPISLTVLPVELGQQTITFNAKADLGAEAEATGRVTVDGLAELAFTIGQDNGTIEVGAASTYSVQVTNVGNKPDRDVQLFVQLPPGAEVMGVDAPVAYRVEGSKLLFAAVPEMGNKDQKMYRFQIKHQQAGTQIVRAQLTSANWPVAVVKEEGTLVYNDQN